MIAFQFALVTLATYRIAHMISDERGPWDAFHKLRTSVYKRWPDRLAFAPVNKEYADGVVSTTYTNASESSWQFDGITCIDCLSFWLSWITALTIPLYGADYIISALAISAVCVLINHNSK